MGFQTYIFCKEVPSKYRKCRFRDPNFTIFLGGGMPPDPPTIVSSLWPPLTKILAKPLNIGVLITTEATTDSLIYEQHRLALPQEPK